MNLILLHGDNLTESSTRLHQFIDSANSRKWAIKRIRLTTEKSLKEEYSSNLVDTVQSIMKSQAQKPKRV